VAPALTSFAGRGLAIMLDEVEGQRASNSHAGQCSRIDIVCAGQFRYSKNGSISPSWPV
jgi:hypothetical protein